MHRVQTIVAVSETNEQIMELANIATLCTFNPRDAMLARVLAMTLCLAVSVCHNSQVGVLSKRLDELGWLLAGSFLRPILTVCIRNQVPSKNKGTFLWNFAPNSGLRKFRHNILIIEACYQLSSRKVDAQSVKNLTVVGQLS